MTNSHKLVIRGQKVTTRTNRRYAAVTVRALPMQHAVTGETYVPFAHVIKRTDSLETARKAIDLQHNPGPGTESVVIDLVTGEEV